MEEKLETDAKGGKLHNVRPVLVKRQNMHKDQKAREIQQTVAIELQGNDITADF